MVRQQFFGSETNFELSTCAHFVISFHFLQLGVGVLLSVRLGSYFLDLAFNLPISWHWMTLSDAWQRRLPIKHNMAQWMLFNIDAGLNKAFRFGDNDSARIRWHLNITWNINKTQMISLFCVPSMPNTITIHTTNAVNPIFFGSDKTTERIAKRRKSSDLVNLLPFMFRVCTN